MAHDKDTKLGVGPSAPFGPPRPGGKSSSAPPRPPSGSISKLVGGHDAAPSSASPRRAKLPSIEEISSSLLLADDGHVEGVVPAPRASVEELSGSLLLEDPDASGESRAAVNGHPAAAHLSSDTIRPSTTAPDTVRPATAAHRAPIEMPQLPTSTPPPDLSALSPSVLPPQAATPHFAVEPPPALHDVPARNTPSSLPTTIAWPSPIAPLGHAQASAAPLDDDDPYASQREPPEPAYPVMGDVEVTSLPRSPLQTAIDRAGKALRGLRSRAGSRGARPPWLLPLAGAGLVLGIGLVVITASGPSKPAKKNAAAAARQPAAPLAAHAAPRALEPAHEQPAQLPCVVEGAPHVIANSATVAAGIEVRPLGDAIALGFAGDDHHASAVRVDPATLAVSATVDSPSAGAIRRVTPVASSAPAANGALALVIDQDDAGDSLQGRRAIPLSPPLDLGASGAGLWWARPDAPPAGKLWALEGSGRVEALRGAVETLGGTTTTAVALRREGAIWLGAATGTTSLAPRGPLSRVDGLGAGVGQPAIALSGGGVLAAWADRASAKDPWRLRWVRFKAGEAPSAPGTFMPPAGGQGEQAMSPGIAAVPGGRFLLVWTEGPAERHDVRALTLSRDGQPLGKPLVISNRGVNSGQGQAAVTSSQRGVVAFLESSGDGFAVVATGVSCL